MQDNRERGSTLGAPDFYWRPRAGLAPQTVSVSSLSRAMTRQIVARYRDGDEVQITALDTAPGRDGLRSPRTPLVPHNLPISVFVHLCARLCRHRDGIHVASRQCDEAKPGQILISPRVPTKVEDAVEVEPVGEFELKAIRRPLAAYNVVAIQSSEK